MFLAVRGEKGIHLASGPPDCKVRDDVFQPDTAKNCKSMAFSPDGQSFAWCNGEALVMARFDAASGVWSTKWKSEEAKRTAFIAFSPKSTFLASWEVFGVRAGETGSPNLRIWNVETGSVVMELIQRKADGWCPQWSKDEKVCCLRSANNEAFFYTDNNFSQATSRLSLAKMTSFSMSPTAATSEQRHHVVAFVPGQKGGPSIAKLFGYPRFNPEKDAIISKSFFNADKLDTEWSKDGRSVILLAQAEVDKTGASYYGKTQVHYLDIEGESLMVQLPKDGPIYHLAWAPNAPQFVVVYGYMPAKATIFNKKCEPVFDFGTGPRNMALYNPQGNVLMLAGFGNLRGVIEMWDVAGKKEISKFEAPDSTDVKWSPDGQLIVTSTCAPRLRMSNGYKIWHYTSTLLCEKLCEAKEELWEVNWRPDSSEKPAAFTILTKPVAGGVQTSQPVASKQAYRPPGARGIVSNFKLHDEDELPQNKKPETSGSAPPSKSALKNKKRRDKKKDDTDTAAPTTYAPPTTSTSAPASSSSSSTSPSKPLNSADPETAKKIRKVNDKLSQIAKLKAMQKEGKPLELNQLQKIEKEGELIQELRALQLGS